MFDQGWFGIRRRGRLALGAASLALAVLALAGAALLTGSHVASAAAPVQVCVGTGCVPDTQVHYVYWTSINVTGGVATGTITLPSGPPVNVTFTAVNPDGSAGSFYSTSQTSSNCSTNYWIPTGTYTSAQVPNAPPDCGIVALKGGTNQTYRMTFSQPVEDPLMAIVSLGQQGKPTTYDFDRPFNIVSQGTGFWGTCSAAPCLTQLPNNVLQGIEGDGTVQFPGTFPSFSWTVPTPEAWHGFTFGIRTTAALAGQVTVNEGQTATNTGNWTGDAATTTLSASAGTVVQNADGTWSWSFATTDGPAQSQLITITATDGTQTATTNFPLVVNNVAPTAVLTNNGPVLLGAPVTVSFGSPADPSPVDLAAGLHYAFACDGSSLASATYATSGVSQTAQCTYATAGTHTVTGRVIDKDGGFNDYQTNVAVAPPPTITWVSTSPAPNGNGWNNSPVTVTWTCTNSTTTTETVVLSRDAANQSATGICTSSYDSSLTATDTQTGINIDQTAPSLAPTVSPNPVVLNGTATADPGATDGLSLVATASCDPVVTSAVGSFSVHCTATDNAGNTATAGASYDVGYAVCTPKASDGHGDSGHSVDSSHGSKESHDSRASRQSQGNESGRTIPVRISLCDANGVNVSSRSIVVTAVGLSPTGTLNDSGHANPGNVFRYVDHGYLFNLSTKGLAPGDYTLDFKVAGDPAVHHYAFTIRPEQADHGKGSGDAGSTSGHGSGGKH